MMIIQIKEKNKIKYSVNSAIAVFKESLNKSNTAAGVYSKIELFQYRLI
jgi:hypothetical protein